MSAVRQLIEHLFSPSPRLPQRIATIVPVVGSLLLCELQQFIRQLSFILYQKEPHCTRQLTVLQLLKSLLLTGSFNIYLLVNVYISPWVVSLNQLHKDRNIHKRAELMYRDAAGSNQQNKTEGVLSYKELLQFSGEFLVFFAENLKFHPFSKYKIKQILAKQLDEGSYSRSLEYFIEKDMSLLQKNLKNYTPKFREDLNNLTEFLSQTVQRCLTDPTKYQDSSYLLLSLIQMSESYCITAIIYRTCSYLTPQSVLTACQFLHSVISLAELESIEIINSKCLPLILEYLLPIDFKNNRILNKVKYSLDGSILDTLADYFFIWSDKTRIVGLSTRIYQYSYNMISWLKKPAKLAYQSELKEFVAKVAKMKNNNESKQSFIIDQNLQIQRYTISLLKEAEFCLNSQKRQQIAFSNVLDSLTLTQKSSQKMSEFSESLVRSANNREEGEEGTLNLKGQKGLKGPPHKKFAELQSSISEVNENPLVLTTKKQSILSRISQKSSQNIYYTRHSPKMPNFSQAVASKSKSPTAMDFYYTEKQRFQHSSKQVYQASSITVHAKASTPQKTPADSPQNSMFMNSSQYSQKDNVQKNKISSIYLNKERDDQSESGEFLHFEKDSIAKSQVKQNQYKRQKGKEVDSDIQFQDSMKLQKSHSQELIQYGMDRDAKLPISFKKPKFAFKLAETNDQSAILKDISLTQKHSPKKTNSQEKQQEYATPEQYSPLIMKDIKDSRPDEMILEKRTQKTKAALKSQDYRSPTKASERMETIKNVKSIYLNQIQPESSQSQIREMSAEPYADSASNSLSSGNVPSNFGSFFKRNTKKEKASSLHSSRSLRKLKIPSRQVQIPNFKKMRDLQNQLGRLKQETQNYQKLLVQKSKEKQILQTRKQKLVEEDPYFLKKQNQIIKTMLKKKSKDEVLISSQGSAQNLARELKESSIKNNNMSLKDYNPDVLKIKMENVHGYSKNQKKNMVANRCAILKNDSIEIGYSLKDKTVTLYFTLKHHCDSLEIHLLQNSLIYSESIQRQFDKVFVGKQMKFKTRVQGTKDQNPFINSSIQIRISYEQKMQKKVQEYTSQLPLTPYNLATPVPCNELSSISQQRHSITHYITPLYSSCEDLLKKRNKYLEHLFPHGQFDQESNTYNFGYLWKQKIENIKIKVKERAFRIEGSGYPMETGRELIEDIINMLVAPISTE